MRLIDADALKQEDFQDFSNTDVMAAIDRCPTIDLTEKIAEAVYNSVSDQLCEMKLELQNDIYNVQSNVNSTVENEGSSTRSEVRHSVGGISGQMYSIQSRVDSMRR